MPECFENKIWLSSPTFEKVGLPVAMNPYDEQNSEPNFWLSCILIEPEAMCKQVRGEKEALYVSEYGKSCPTEILEKLAPYNAEGRSIWNPKHTELTCSFRCCEE